MESTKKIHLSITTLLGKLTQIMLRKERKKKRKKRKIPEQEYNQVISILNHQKQAVLAGEQLSQLTLLFKCRREIY